MISHTARQITATTGTTMRDRPEPSMPDGSLAWAEDRAAADAAVAEVADRIIGGFQPVPGGAEHDFAVSGEHNQVLKVGAGVDEVADDRDLAEHEPHGGSVTAPPILTTTSSGWDAFGSGTASN
jgi:hypothetical protein